MGKNSQNIEPLRANLFDSFAPINKRHQKNNHRQQPSADRWRLHKRLHQVVIRLKYQRIQFFLNADERFRIGIFGLHLVFLLGADVQIGLHAINRSPLAA